MGRRSQRKGAAWEREVGHLLEKATGRPAVRNLEERRSGGGRDLVTPLPLCVQAKVGARPNPLAALEEAQSSAVPGELPVAVVKQHNANSPRVAAVLPLDRFLALLPAIVRALEEEASP
jgi:hypothetical protein